MQVLKTKLSRPSITSNMAMQRPKLLGDMLDYCQSSLTFIHAAAGYGKTTLMYQLSESLLDKGQRVSWLTLDDDDNDPIRLYQYLWLALLGVEQLHAIPQGHIHKQNIIELVQLVAELETDNFLFIDELELLTNPECLNILWWLYQYLPTNCHLIIASRVKPNWSFAKEYLIGRLKFVTEAHLSIKVEDSAALIQFLQSQNFDHVTLTSELAEQLIKKTEGWLTGIQLTNLYLKNYHDVGAVIHSLNGAHNQIVDYLSEQVFIQLSEEVQDFLLKISVLRKINLSNIQAVSQNSASTKLLELMVQKGLFLQALNEQHSWYRIHALFREFLENRFKLQNFEQYQATHLRAAYWYKQHDYLMEAIYHAECAKDQVLVVELLSEVSRELVLEGRFYTLLELVKLIPDELLLQHSGLLYDIIWLLTITHQSLQANHYLQLWLNLDIHENSHGEEHLGLAPMDALMKDDIQQAYQLAQQNVPQLSESAYFVRAPLVGIGALYHIGLGKMVEARKIIIQTRALYIQGHNIYGLIMTDCIEALCDHLEGHIDKALAKFDYIGKSEDYLRLSSDEQLKPMISMITSSVKANLYYELNEIDLAEQALQSFDHGGHLIIPDLVIIGYELLLRLAHIQGNVQNEKACLTQSQIYANDWAVPRLSRMVQSIDAQFQWFEQGQKLHEAPVENLEELCRQHLNKTLNIANLMTGDDLIQYRQLIFTHQEAVATEFLLAELKRVSTYPLRKVRVLLLLALSAYRLNQTETTYEWLEQALTLLEPTKAHRLVLDEHPLIWEVLECFSQHLMRHKSKQMAMLLPYIQQLQKLNHVINNADETVLNTGIEALSKREVQILEKLSAGYTDAEISETIFLSINTVKWHLRNIYNKLAVRSRLEAVTEAKKRGLI